MTKWVRHDTDKRKRKSIRFKYFDAWHVWTWYIETFAQYSKGWRGKTGSLRFRLYEISNSFITYLVRYIDVRYFDTLNFNIFDNIEVLYFDNSGVRYFDSFPIHPNSTFRYFLFRYLNISVYRKLFETIPYSTVVVIHATQASFIACA